MKRELAALALLCVTAAALLLATRRGAGVGALLAAWLASPVYLAYALMTPSDDAWAPYKRCLSAHEAALARDFPTEHAAFEAAERRQSAARMRVFAEIQAEARAAGAPVPRATRDLTPAQKARLVVDDPDATATIEAWLKRVNDNACKPLLPP